MSTICPVLFSKALKDGVNDFVKEYGGFLCPQHIMRDYILYVEAKIDIGEIPFTYKEWSICERAIKDGK